MYIDQWKDEEGYYDEENNHYDSAIEFIGTGIFDFCGCGDLKAALNYIREALQLIAGRENVYSHDDSDRWVQRCKEFFRKKGADYFMWYWMDEQVLMEHGSSVPGWLTEHGKGILSDLTELKEKGKLL